VILSGCTHALEVKNRNDFVIDMPTTLKTPVATGVATTNSLANGKLLVDATVEALRNRNSRVIYPYRDDLGTVDLLIQIAVTSHHEGSGSNFWINWPGFLIWTPAWHGYVYKPHYNVKVLLVDPGSGETRDTFDIPIDLDVRHASYNRTWTEISWLEVSLIALVGGVVFTSYDDNVTPLVEREMRQELGVYLAEKILQRIKELEIKPVTP